MWWRLHGAVLGQAGEQSDAQGVHVLDHKHQEPSGLQAAWEPPKRLEGGHNAFGRWMYTCKPGTGSGTHNGMAFAGQLRQGQRVRGRLVPTWSWHLSAPSVMPVGQTGKLPWPCCVCLDGRSTASGEDDLLPKAHASASCSQYSVQRQLVPVH